MKKIAKIKLSILSILFLIGCSGGVGTPTPKVDLITPVDLTGKWQMTTFKLSYEAKTNGVLEAYNDEDKGTVDDVIEFKSGNILNDPNDIFITRITKWSYKQNGAEIAIGNGIEISYFKVIQTGKNLRLEMDATLAKKSLKESKDFNNIIYLDPKDEIVKFEFVIEFIVAPVTVIEDPKIAPTITRNVTGEWLGAEGGAGGTGNFESYKNFQYNFEVGANNQKVEISLKSPDIDVQFVVFDPLGQRLLTSSTGRSVANIYTLNTGKYRLVVCAARRAVGKFEFLVNGITGNPIKISSQFLQSGTQSWDVLGGGGPDKSYKNQFYTFEVTEDNSSVDVELSSADTEVGLHLYDELGQRIVYQYANRYEYKTIAVKRGIYTVMAATNKRGSIGNYQVNIFGKIRNLKRITSQVNSVTGRWATNTAVDTYSLQITSTANSPLDIEVSSADANPYIYLQSSVGSDLETRLLTQRINFITSKDLPKGTYRIKVIPGGNKEFGNYTLTVHGLFTDFKKL